MSAKLGLITHLIPKSDSAQGACSREEPQPKFFPDKGILDSEKGFLFKIK